MTIILCLVSFALCDDKDVSNQKGSVGWIYAKVENTLEFNDIAKVRIIAFDRIVHKNVELACCDWKMVV